VTELTPQMGPTVAAQVRMVALADVWPQLTQHRTTAALYTNALAALLNDMQTLGLEVVPDADGMYSYLVGNVQRHQHKIDYDEDSMTWKVIE
jgi:hypothetical protein